jgi:hypothetical protein
VGTSARNVHCIVETMRLCRSFLAIKLIRNSRSTIRNHWLKKSRPRDCIRAFLSSLNG